MRTRLVSGACVGACCILISTFLNVGFSSSASASDVRPNVKSEAIDAQVIVKFKSNVSNAAANSRLTKNKLDRREKLNNEGIYLYQSTQGISANEVVKDLKSSGLVEYAELDYKVSTDSITNDTYADSLWGLRNFGQSIFGQSGQGGIDINVKDVWDSSTGNGVVVGVLDEGVDISHPELSSHVFTNISDCYSDGVDHDGNGYINDCHGWDFYHNDKTVFDAADGDDHGTHVAGTIAAAANNSTGITGVAPDVSILPLKFLGAGGGSTSDAILAIAYAQEFGVKIINCSWGGAGFSQSLKDAMSSSNILFTVSSGNSGLNIATSPQYPAAFNLQNVVTVAAVDNKGALATFSNYGGPTAVGAPGVDILSTVPKNPALSVAVENRNGSNTWSTAFWGFGLEAVVGANSRRDILAGELTKLGATTTSPILLVDDDESSSTQDTRNFYTAALNAGGFNNVSIHNVTSGTSGPNSATMSGKFVIWMTGYSCGGCGSNSTYALTNTDLTQLQTFVTAGGHLLLTGGDAIWQNESSSFVSSTLGVTYIDEGDPRTAVTGVASTTFDAMTFNIAGTESPLGNLNQYQDTIAASGAFAVSVLELQADSSYANAYEYKSGTSMAAPHVAGIAALALSAAPTASTVALASYIKAGGQYLPSLLNKTTTAGLADAQHSVTIARQLNGGVASYSQLGPPAPTDGYRFVASDGGVFSYGNKSFYGSAGGNSLNRPVVAVTSTPSGEGYWLVASDGGIFAYGDARFFGSTGAIKLNQPIVGMAASPTGNGYWLVASDGGIFAYGDARFFGSTGAIKLNQPIVGMAASPTGNGYWLVASDGGIFAYGDARFFGSTGAIKLNQPIVAMAASQTGGGYWLVASDGGIFAYGDSPLGSTGSIKLNQPVVGISSTSSGNGYWLIAKDGGVFSYGDAGFFGSAGALKLNRPIVGMSH